MHAHVGDRVHVRGRIVGQAEHTGQVEEVREQQGSEPIYVVRYDNGPEALLCPGPDTVVEHRRECPSS
jgi:hypothetical protein